MIKIGHGYDVHRFGSDKKLMLGCTEIPFEKGLIAHSDGDVVCHALCDCLLGASGNKDIGNLFPDTDDKYKGASGKYLLGEVLKVISAQGYILCNADITVIAEFPKLSGYISLMRKNIAEVLNTRYENINVKATTEEGLGIAGKGIACHAVCLLEKVD